MQSSYTDQSPHGLSIKINTDKDSKKLITYCTFISLQAIHSFVFIEVYDRPFERNFGLLTGKPSIWVVITCNSKIGEGKMFKRFPKNENLASKCLEQLPPDLVFRFQYCYL